MPPLLNYKDFLIFVQRKRPRTGKIQEILAYKKSL